MDLFSALWVLTAMNCKLEEQEHVLGFMNGEDFIFRVFIIYLKALSQ